MRRLLSSRLLWVTLAVVLLIIHSWWAWHAHDGTHIARCGATWIVFAGAIIARPIIRVGYKAWKRSAECLIIDGGGVEPTPEEIEETRQCVIDAGCVQLLGPGLAVFGTLLWAYGDLMGNAIPRCLS